MREYFNLMEYTEEFINKIIDYRMHMDKELNRYLSYEEIANVKNAVLMMWKKYSMQQQLYGFINLKIPVYRATTKLLSK